MALKHIGRGPKDEINSAITSGDIEAGDIVVTTGDNDGELILIERDNSQVIIKSRTQSDIEVMGVNLSDGIANGKVIPAGTDLDAFIKQLVQKRIAATYSAPSISISNNGGQAATTVETGTTVNLAVKSTFVQNDAGSLISHSISVNGTEVESGTTNTLTYGDSSYVVKDGNNIAKSTVTYAEGAIKKDNFGDDSPNGHIAAGTKTSSNFTIVGARKAFYGALTNMIELTSANIRTLPSNKLNPTAGSTINVTIAEGQQYLVVSLPAGRTLKQVTYVDLGDKGMLEKFTTSTVAVGSAAGDTVNTNNNNVYVYSMAAPAAAAMNFELLLA